MLKYLLMLAAAGVLVVSLVLTGESRRFSPRDLPHTFPTPGLALQFATQTEDVARIVGPAQPEDADRRLMRSQIAKDWVLIAFYVLFFVTGGVWTFRQGLRLIGGLTIAAGLLATAFDVWENAAMLGALKGPGAPAAAPAAYLKWTFFFVATLFVSAATWRVGGPGRAASLVVALAGVGGLAVLWMPPHPIWLNYAAAAFGLGVLLVLVTLVHDCLERLEGGLIGWTGRWVRRADTRLRFVDLWVNRTLGGILGGNTRHTVAAILLPAVLVFFIVNGPSLRPTWRLALGVLVAIVSGLLFRSMLRLGLRRSQSFQRDLIVQCLLIAVIAGVVWVLAPESARERDGTPLYRHVLLAVTALLTGAVLLGSVLAAHLFGSERGRKSVPGRLRQVELFVSLPDPPPVTGWMFLLAAFGAVASSPGRVLFPPALFALFVEREFVTGIFVLVLAVNLALLAFASLDPRFGGSWNLPHRIFFGGWSALVSVGVIVLGICRVADVQYVSTLFDGARNYTLGGYLLVGYVLTWWFDYWTSTPAAVRFLDLVGGRGGADDAQIDYPIDPATPRTSVPAANRVIQTHGAGRLLVLHDHGGPYPYFHSYTPTEAVDVLRAGLPEKDPVRADLEWIKWRLAAHFLVTSAFVVILFGGAGWLLHRLPQQPHIGPPPPGSPPFQPLDVASVIVPAEVCTGETPVIAIAASGGGTRAALYTTSILERLHQQGQLRHVRIMSGVSGGGAALAYFAAHRPGLLGTDPNAWGEFFKAMKQPYIEDVLDGSGEWRIAADHRLGVLLAESFERYWGDSRRKAMRDITDIGLILNSAIAGRFERKAGDDAAASIGVIERRSGRPGTSDVAGGRVVYTNLALNDHLGNPVLIEEGPSPRPARDTRLPIFVVNGGHVLLSAAAAANANFPPVFSNVAIDRDADLRLWVTDGGAVDNRGTETLLMTLRHAVKAVKALTKQDPSRCATLPPIHVVEVEASAFSDSYSQDRGLGSMMSAGTAFASQLDAELLADIREQTGKRVRFHYLPMPQLLRRSGSFGTHWMMQDRITLCRDPRCRASIVLRGDDVVKVLRALDKPSLEAGDSSNAKEAHAFILREEPELKPNWDRLSACLRAVKAGC